MQEGENGSVDLPEQMVGSQRGDGCQGLGGSALCWRPRSPWDLPGPGELLEAWPSWEQIPAPLPGSASPTQAMAQAETPCEEQRTAREKTHSVHAQLKAYEQQQVQKSEMVCESLRFLEAMSH